MSLFRTSRRIEFVDTDMAGIVHFSNFFRFMEAAEVDFLRSLDLSVKMTTEAGDNIGFPRVCASCDYLRPLVFQDVAEVTVAVVNVGQKSVTYRFEFFKGSDLAARGQISAVCCRFEDDRKLESLPIPDAIRAKLEAAIERET